MVKIAYILILSIFVTNTAMADCVWGRDVVKNESGYQYSRDCHIEVGRLVEENKLLKEKADRLEKALTLSDLALRKSEENSALWMGTSFKAQERLQTIENTGNFNNWLHFGLGVGVAILSVWAAGQLK